MKKILLSSVFFLVYILSIRAQVLYGTTFNGGNDGGGALTKFVPATNTLTVPTSFESLALHPQSNNLLQASDGKLYGMTAYGGSKGTGIIFSYDPSNANYAKLKDFDSTDGVTPTGSLVQANDGKLYGMTSQGGSSGNGVIFSFDPSASTYTRVKDFDHDNGANPSGSLMQANDGKLYGMAGRGGTSDSGVIFSFDPVSLIYTKLKDFNNDDGAYPVADLIQAIDGKLYGVTNLGGNGSTGVIFSYDLSTATYTKLKDFDALDPFLPSDTLAFFPNGLLQAGNGKLYGMTGGVIFSFDIAASTFTKLKYFDNANNYGNGHNPLGNLIQASDGKLYGITNGGGNHGKGVIFSFDIPTSNYINLKDFDGINGGGPYGSLMQANDGKFYAMTHEGGAGSDGVIFSFDPTSAIYTKLKDFGSNTNGSNLPSAMVKANNGKLYGVTNAGGRSGLGTFYSYDPASATYAKLKDFDGTMGANPIGSPIQANDGKLYGTTNTGGNFNAGVIYSFDPSASTFTKLSDFDTANGGFPYNSLIQAGNNKIYGMTPGGGSKNFGVLYSYDISSSTFTRIMEFDKPTGTNPFGSLVQATNGKLYGTTFGGGSSDVGVIFSFEPSSSTYTKLKDFDNTNGARPFGNLIQAGDGKLYGVTFYGGTSNNGVIFSYDISTSTLSKLEDFDGINGINGVGSLKEASDGKLYGMTTNGGSKGFGVIFSYDPSTGTYVKLQDFDYTNGAHPYYGAAFVEVSECTADTTYYKDQDGDGFGNPDSSIKACSRPAAYVTNSTDCNDSNAAIHAPVTYYRDKDRDGLGNPYDSISVCETTPPTGYVRNNFDCDDHFKPWRHRDAKILMCHHGKEECVKRKDVLARLFQGWTLGPCSISPCGPNEILMCHKGQEECVKRKDVWFRLFHGWTFGPCFPGSASSQNANDISENDELDKELAIPGQYKLSNYPNPFAGTTTIKYELPTDSKVSIIVYDLLGRVVATLVDENKKAGTYTVDFNAGHVNKGSLYYRIIATSKDKQFKQTNKMIQLQ